MDESQGHMLSEISQSQTNKQTNKQKKKNKVTPNTSSRCGSAGYQLE